MFCRHNKNTTWEQRRNKGNSNVHFNLQCVFFLSRDCLRNVPCFLVISGWLSSTVFLKEVLHDTEQLFQSDDDLYFWRNSNSFGQITVFPFGQNDFSYKNWCNYGHSRWVFLLSGDKSEHFLIVHRTNILSLRIIESHHIASYNNDSLSCLLLSQEGRKSNFNISHTYKSSIVFIKTSWMYCIRIVLKNDG